MAVDAENFQTGADVFRVDERDGAGDGSDQFQLHIIRINNLRRRGSLRAENFRDPILFELRLRHLVDDAKHDVAFAGDGGADEKHHGKLGIPVLAFAKKDFADFGETEVVDGSIGMNDDGDVGRARRLTN